MLLQIRSPLALLTKAPVKKGGTNGGFKVPLVKGDLGGSSKCCTIL